MEVVISVARSLIALVAPERRVVELNAHDWKAATRGLCEVCCLTNFV